MPTSCLCRKMFHLIVILVNIFLFAKIMTDGMTPYITIHQRSILIMQSVFPVFITIIHDGWIFVWLSVF